MSQQRIRSACESRLATWAASKGLPVVWQNVGAGSVSGDHLRAFLCIRNIRRDEDEAAAIVCSAHKSLRAAHAAPTRFEFRKAIDRAGKRINRHAFFPILISI